MSSPPPSPDHPLRFAPRSLPLGRLSLPGPGCVHLWFLDLQHLGNPLRIDETGLPLELTVRQRRSLRRFYLRLLLGAYLDRPGKDVAISRQIKGKPVLERRPSDPAVDFSMANSGSCCLVGLASTGLLGVDLEQEQRRVASPRRLAARYFSEREARTIATVNPASADRAFMHTWALKEAVVKGVGHGIADQLHRFTVSCDPDQPPAMLEMQDDDAAAWRLATFQVAKGLIGAVALRHPELRMEAFELTRRN